MPTGHYVRTKFVPVFDRMMRKTTKTKTCWLWRGSTGYMGHGQIMCDRNIHSDRFLQSTHRVSWEHFNGPIPDGLCVLHRCDVPNCINPDHLFLGTKADNTNDMIAKGRVCRGEQLPQSKLTEREVRAIRNAAGSQLSIAKKFGITQPAVNAIKSRKLWKHVV